MTNYKEAGVDVEAGYEAVKLMKKHIARTTRPEVLSEIGGFGGLFKFDTTKFKEPVLISGTDGVGTKLKIAFLMDKHDTIGMDCVAMCVNDIICSGAEPLFFLDYIALGKNIPEKVEQIVKGVAEGCVQSGCALIGGETAEMPGFYPVDEYDLAGFAVGAVDRESIIDGKSITDGDLIVGLPSSGIHSNGYSLVRKVFNPDAEKLGQFVESLGCTLGEELLKPTRIYVKTVLELIRKFRIKGISHITGGGFIENLPRMLPSGMQINIERGTWPVLPIFDEIRGLGGLSERDMYNTFNMGIGMALAVDPDTAREIMSHLKKSGEKAYIIGKISTGDKGLELC
ncbi:MAG: phosphoribosylformylglycinamidine cyclo-ligase [Eubacteriales bacterium]|nr:phosphoribosylformylglycinamidine cyclo-ligase [Eubacteriales bacterium]